MASQKTSIRRNHSKKSASNTQSVNYDSESETAVTSTSGQVKTPVIKRLASTSLPVPKSCKPSKAPLGSVHFTHKSLSRKLCNGVTPVKEEVTPVKVVTPDKSLSLSRSSGNRLLMREWLIQEVTHKRIPGLKWLDKNQQLICIPWIHASKEGWSQVYHCKLFEKWAIYTGKYDPQKDKPDPKRWKANFRCALNSLLDVKEMPKLNHKNGMDGYKVYQFNEPIERKGHRKHKLVSRTLTSESQDVCLMNQSRKNLQTVEAYSVGSTVPSASMSCCYQDDFTDSYGNPLASCAKPSNIIACSAEPVHDTVPSNVRCFTSLSSASDEGPIVMNIENQETDILLLAASKSKHICLENDIISLRNMDHNYFKVQIPTTVENYEDDDGPPVSEPSPTAKRKTRTRTL